MDGFRAADRAAEVEFPGFIFVDNAWRLSYNGPYSKPIHRQWRLGGGVTEVSHAPGQALAGAGQQPPADRGAQGISVMKKAFLFTAIVLLLAAVSALAGMQSVDDEALADIQASMGARLDMRGGRAVSNAWGYQDIDGAPYANPWYTANGNRGYLFFGSVGYTDTAGTGNINLWNMTLDIGAEGTTEFLIIGFPSIDGRIAINDIRIGNCSDYNAQAGQIAPWNTNHYWNSWPSTSGTPVGSVYMQNITFAPGSAIMMWGN